EPVDSDKVDGEFIIGAELSASLQADLGLDLVDYDPILGAGLYRTGRALDVASLETALKQQLGGVRVEANRLRTVSSVNDPYRELQWNLDLLDIDTAWTWNRGEGVIVAVIDTGVSIDGEDAPVNYIAGYDYVDNDWNPADENGHGTHVAGTIAQATDNGIGVAGVAPDASIMAIRVLDRFGSGSAYWSAKAIIFAADNGADVVNLSLGSRSSTAAERDAVEYAADRDVIVVAASGNSGRNVVEYPAAYPDAIAVGAVGANSAVVGYSNGGTDLDLVAPGGDMNRDRNGDGYYDGILQETFASRGRGMAYEFFEGTSMATPHVAAVAALLIAEGADPRDVRDILTDTAVDLESAGWNTRSGFGLIDPVAALGSIGAPGGPVDDGGDDDTDADPGEPDDTTAPVIYDVTGSRSGEDMTLLWRTDEPTTTGVIFEEFGRFDDDSGLVTDHEMRFTVDPNTTFYFTLRSEDAAGNVTEDGVWVMYP
ncbi:MAG: serine protease, partial [Myxococcota bacterium]